MSSKCLMLEIFEPIFCIWFWLFFHRTQKLSSLGWEVSTPRFAKLAERKSRFRFSYCSWFADISSSWGNYGCRHTRSGYILISWQISPIITFLWEGWRVD
jgi:hypothetical protein